MVKGVIFDLDGTITRPVLDFDEIRSAMGLKAGKPVLEQLRELPLKKRAQKEAVLHGFEKEAAARSELNPGVEAMFAALKERGKMLALCTRNSTRAAEDVLHRHNLTFPFVRTRDHGEVKPSPEPILALARTMGLHTSELAMVGDYAFDTEAALGAGAFAVFFTGGHPLRQKTRYHFRLDRIDDLIGVIDRIDREGLRPSDLPVREEGSHG